MCVFILTINWKINPLLGHSVIYIPSATNYYFHYQSWQPRIYDLAKEFQTTSKLVKKCKFVGTSFGLVLDWIGPELASTWWHAVSARQKRSGAFLGEWGSFCDKQLHIFRKGWKWPFLLGLKQILRNASLLSWEKRNPPKVAVEYWLLRYVRGRFKN